MICDETSIVIDRRNYQLLMQIFEPLKMSSSAFKYIYIYIYMYVYLKNSQKRGVLSAAFTAHSAGCCLKLVPACKGNQNVFFGTAEARLMPASRCEQGEKGPRSTGDVF